LYIYIQDCNTRTWWKQNTGRQEGRGKQRGKRWSEDKRDLETFSSQRWNIHKHSHDESLGPRLEWAQIQS
jgi:hypothetical protein